jgi:nitroimidazol reductase NimA-like FMN-containing flavoprotein (pyridoxamine 5'-phosphate oxidase superfamily)
VSPSPTESWFPGHLRELDRAECLELLATKTVGRVAYCTPVVPEILPLNYTLTPEGTLLIRTSPHTTLGRHLPHTTAAFQVDDIDDYTETGWSVLLRGTTTPLTTDELPPTPHRPRPWAEGTRPLHLRLTPHTITGRRLLPA